MTQINLDTHEFGHKITPEHKFAKFIETAVELKDVKPAGSLLPEPAEPTDPSETSLLIEDLTVQLQSADMYIKILKDSRNSWRNLAIQYAAELTEYEMSYWAKVKRWAKKQWAYDIYDEHLKG